jgi:hypothetical protein
LPPVAPIVPVVGSPVVVDVPGPVVAVPVPVVAVDPPPLVVVPLPELRCGLLVSSPVQPANDSSATKRTAKTPKKGA